MSSRVQVALQDTFVRTLPELAVHWQAESTPDPTAARAQRTARRRARPGRGVAAQPRGARAADRHRCPGRGGAGRAGLCGSPVRRLRAPARGRPRAAARRVRRRRWPDTRSALEGFRADAVRPRRRRSGRGRTDAARIRDQRGDACARHPDHALAGRGRHRPDGLPRDGAARRCARPGRRQPSARRQLPVRRIDRAQHRGHRRAAPARRLRDRPAPSARRGSGRARTWRCWTGSPRRRPASSRSGCWPGSCTG